MLGGVSGEWLSVVFIVAGMFVITATKDITDC